MIFQTSRNIWDNETTAQLDLCLTVSSLVGLPLHIKIVATIALLLVLKTATSYDPLDVSAKKVETLELTVKDKERDRDIPLLVYLPESTDPAAVIFYSHGLGGTKSTSPFLGKHWAARGYVAVFVQHLGSDDAVWKDVPRLQRMREMRKAASLGNLVLRAGDVTAVIDQLERWADENDHPLEGRMDLTRIGMCGHSFGALTTQYIGGQNVLGSARYADARVKAAIPMSPSAPLVGSAERTFNRIKMPWLCMTGTHDMGHIGGATPENRQAVYPALPAGGKYELVLNDAEHSAFTERALPGDKKPRNPNHHRAIKAISTAFWDTYLQEDVTAKSWLSTEESVRSVLESKDRWQSK